MPNYLEKRRRRWYAYLEIPRDLREHFGKRRHVQSLGTESLTEAERLVLGRVAHWKAEFEAVRTGLDLPLEKLADEWRKDYAHASESDRGIYEDILQEKIEDIQRYSPVKADAFDKIVRGETVELQFHIEEWLATLDNQQKTLDMKRSDVKRFAAAFAYSHEVDKRAIQRWVYRLQDTDRLKLTTINRIISACRGYWSFLDRAGYMSRDDAPFLQVVDKSRAKSKAKSDKLRQPFEAEDVVKLLQEAERNEDHQLHQLIWLAMWSGSRIEELCSLKVDDVSKGSFNVKDSKTQAGIRTVPVHSKLGSRLTELCLKSSDGYVLSGLSF